MFYGKKIEFCPVLELGGATPLELYLNFRPCYWRFYRIPKEVLSIFFSRSKNSSSNKFAT